VSFPLECLKIKTYINAKKLAKNSENIFFVWNSCQILMGSYMLYGDGGGVLTPLSTIFHFYRGSQFYWWRKPPAHRKSLTNDGWLYTVYIDRFPAENKIMNGLNIT
jgi:hypothetical protein